MKSLLAVMLAAAGGFGGAMGYNYYMVPATQAPQIVVQSDPQLHADLVALQGTMQESLRLNQEAWGQQLADRAQRQAQINRWNSDLQQFNQKVK